MSKRRKDPLLEALKEGRSYTWTVPEGGNLASMRKAIKHGQTLTMSPVKDPKDIQVGDLVLVKWHQSDIFHIVGEIREGQFLIVNSLGKINGWVDGKEILGKITKIIEPEPRLEVPLLLDQLEAAYLDLIGQWQIDISDGQRLLSMVDDLRWYSGRIGAERWDVMPRDNIWSFHQNLWRLTRQTTESLEEEDKTIELIDLGKRCIGLATEIIRLFESDRSESV
jgi:hypothetical protein